MLSRGSQQLSTRVSVLLEQFQSTPYKDAISYDTNSSYVPAATEQVEAFSDEAMMDVQNISQSYKVPFQSFAEQVTRGAAANYSSGSVATLSAFCQPDANGNRSLRTPSGEKSIGPLQSVSGDQYTRCVADWMGQLGRMTNTLPLVAPDFLFLGLLVSFGLLVLLTAFLFVPLVMHMVSNANQTDKNNQKRPGVGVIVCTILASIFVLFCIIGFALVFLVYTQMTHKSSSASTLLPSFFYVNTSDISSGTTRKSFTDAKLISCPSNQANYIFKHSMKPGAWFLLDEEHSDLGNKVFVPVGNENNFVRVEGAISPLLGEEVSINNKNYIAVDKALLCDVDTPEARLAALILTPLSFLRDNCFVSEELGEAASEFLFRGELIGEEWEGRGIIPASRLDWSRGRERWEEEQILQVFDQVGGESVSVFPAYCKYVEQRSSDSSPEISRTFPDIIKDFTVYHPSKCLSQLREGDKTFRGVYTDPSLDRTSACFLRPSNMTEGDASRDVVYPHALTEEMCVGTFANGNKEYTTVWKTFGPSDPEVDDVIQALTEDTLLTLDPYSSEVLLKGHRGNWGKDMAMATSKKLNTPFSLIEGQTIAMAIVPNDKLSEFEEDMVVLP
mmetsp:Transcript_39719/g.102254  ORF Transcript_39719/g.102254 Transcript_39719/m.102254 type:complete len:615 (-) Transcript_39719:226-2070(-)